MNQIKASIQEIEECRDKLRVVVSRLESKVDNNVESKKMCLKCGHYTSHKPVCDECNDDNRIAALERAARRVISLYADKVSGENVDWEDTVQDLRNALIK